MNKLILFLLTVLCIFNASAIASGKHSLSNNNNSPEDAPNLQHHPIPQSLLCLPLEMLEQIKSHLNPVEKERIESLYTQKGMMLPLKPDFTVRQLDFTYHLLNDTELDLIIKAYPNLTKLNLSFNLISAGSSSLALLKNLVELDLRGNDINDYRSAPLAQLTNLKILKVGGYQDTVRVRGILQFFQKNALPDFFQQINPIEFALRQSMAEAPVNVRGVNFTSAREMSLPLQQNKIGHGAQQIARYLTKLEVLDLESNGVGAMEVRYIGENLIALHALNLSGNNLESRDLWTLPNLIHLHTLNLSRNTLTTLMYLTQLTNLQSLQLEHNKLTDCRLITNLANLTDLDLDDNKVDSSSIQLIALHVTNLKRLMLNNTNIDIAQMPALNTLTNLTVLGLRRCIWNNDAAKALIHSFRHPENLYMPWDDIMKNDEHLYAFAFAHFRRVNQFPLMFANNLNNLRWLQPDIYKRINKLAAQY